MTQRYEHLRDDTLKKASNLAGTLVNEAISKNTDRNEKITTIGNKIAFICRPKGKIFIIAEERML